MEALYRAFGSYFCLIIFWFSIKNMPMWQYIFVIAWNNLFITNSGQNKFICCQKKKQAAPNKSAKNPAM